jgi:hypothetical protein
LINIRLNKWHTSGTTIDDNTNPFAMRFTPSGDFENLTKRITRHQAPSA